LAEIFPLRFRLREELRFLQAGSVVIAEKVRTGQRYSVKAWQHEMLMSFNGKTTFEAAAKRAYTRRPGAFSANGLLNFYNWLYTENLVLCECDSIFELVIGDGEPDRGDSDDVRSEIGLSEFAGRLLEDSRVRRGLAIAVALVFSLSVIRLVYIAAPVFEPPVNRLYAELGQWFDSETPVGTIAESQRAAADSSVEAVELSARAPERTPAVPESSAPERVVVKATEKAEPLVAPADLPEAISVSRIETLRVELEECRIRRDEFYLQNDEEGYRREVHRMTNLAREIGDIEKGR
jgi:hypothetical protein